MKTVKILAGITIVAVIAVAAASQTAEERGTQLMKRNDDQPIFQKVKGESELKIYGSTGELRFMKKLVMASYTENIGTEDQKESYICYFLAPPRRHGQLLPHVQLQDPA